MAAPSREPLAAPDLDRTWEHHPSHFWLVLLVAAVNVVLGLLTGEVDVEDDHLVCGAECGAHLGAEDARARDEVRLEGDPADAVRRLF